MGNHKKLLQFLRPEPPPPSPPATTATAKSSSSPSSSSDDSSDSDDAYSPSTSASALTSPSPSPYAMSPWTQLPGLGASPASSDHLHQGQQPNNSSGTTGLLGSLAKAEGHVYSLAASGDLLYTGTESRVARPTQLRRLPVAQQPRQGHHRGPRRSHLHGPPGRQGLRLAPSPQLRRHRRGGAAPAGLRRGGKRAAVGEAVADGAPRGRGVVLEPGHRGGAALLGLLGPHRSLSSFLPLRSSFVYRSSCCLSTSSTQTSRSTWSPKHAHTCSTSTAHQHIGLSRSVFLYLIHSTLDLL